MNTKNVVIIGANFAGLSAAARLPRQSERSALDIEAWVIDRNEDFVWTPNIHEILSGTKRAHDVRLSSRRTTERLGHHFLKDEVTGIDLDKKLIHLTENAPLAYDACLIACGHTRSTSSVADPTHRGHGFRHSDEVSRLHRCIEQRVARDEPFTVTIVGAGFSGIEALGELLRRYRHVAAMRIRVIERSRRALPGLPGAVAEDVMKQAAPYPVEFVFDTGIREASRDGLTLADGRFVASSETLWTIGTKLPDFITNTGLDTAGASGVLVDKTLQHPETPEIFVAGDAATLVAPVRKQAYYALEMGALAGKNIQRWFREQPLLSFHPANKPILLSFGDLNTYLIQGQTVIASPLLAAAKEAVYQLQMAQLSAALPLREIGLGIGNRFFTALDKLLIPELLKIPLARIIRQSRVLQWGDIKDMEDMTRALVATVLRHNGRWVGP